jgi:protein SCO1
MFSSKGFWVGIAVLGLTCAGVIGLGAFNRPYTYHGSVIQPAMAAPPIQLVDQTGKPFQVEDVQGKVVLLFFGYTHCPDECPTTLAQYRQLRSDLGKQADKVQMLFVTVDPLRDSPQTIGAYLAQYHSGVIGLSGDKAALAEVWKEYGVYVNVPADASSSTGYAVEHSNPIYLIDETGKLRLTYTYGTPTEDMLQDVQHLLKEG